jgi:hypothetical protein
MREIYVKDKIKNDISRNLLLTPNLNIACFNDTEETELGFGYKLVL